jgi:2'-5' RNA ligase
MIRAFFAVELGAEARQVAGRCIEGLRARARGRLSWVRAEGLHVTLRFLGDIAPDQVTPLALRVGPEAAAVAPFGLGLGQLHLFPSPRRPRVVALDVEPAPPLEGLARAVERGVVAAGFPPEPRPFRAHVTLGRVRDGGVPCLDGEPAPSAAPFEVREVVLFESRLGPGGSVYTALERLPLGAGAPAGSIHPQTSPGGAVSLHPQPGSSEEH